MRRAYSYFAFRLLSTLVVCSFTGGSALAHIKNEASQFPDIEFSESRFDIVVLVGVGVIPETPVFEPDKAMLRRDLAIWAALSSQLGEGGETPDLARLAEAALEHGLVDSLDGNASIADVNAAIFGGELPIDQDSRELSKAEAAAFIAQQLNTAAGAGLLERKGLRPGNTGLVSSVEPGHSHHGVATYTMTIDGVAMPMDAHGRVANGPVDLLQWEGRLVGRSFVRGKGENAIWVYLETASDVPVIKDMPKPEVTMVNGSQKPESDRKLFYVLLAASVVFGVLLFFRRRRQS